MSTTSAFKSTAKRYALILDYDGCMAGCFTTRWRVNQFKNSDFTPHVLNYWNAISPMITQSYLDQQLKLVKDSTHFNEQALLALLDQQPADIRTMLRDHINEHSPVKSRLAQWLLMHATHHYFHSERDRRVHTAVSQLKHLVGTAVNQTPSLLCRAIDKMSSYEGTNKNAMQRLIAYLNKVKSEAVKLLNEITQSNEDATNDIQLRYFERVATIVCQFSQSLFVAEVLRSGFNPDIDHLLVLNGSARQSKFIDSLNADMNKNGLISQELPHITAAIADFMRSHLHASDVKSRITHSNVTSVDSTDDQAKAIHSLRASVEPSKLGLWLEQIHFAKRQEHDYCIIFDDRLVAESWSRTKSGTHHIEEAFNYLVRNPHFLPNSDVRLVFFDAKMLSSPAVKGVRRVLGRDFYHLNVGVFGHVSGKGVVQPRHTFKNVLRAHNFHRATWALNSVPLVVPVKVQAKVQDDSSVPVSSVDISCAVDVLSASLKRQPLSSPPNKRDREGGLASLSARPLKIRIPGRVDRIDPRYVPPSVPKNSQTRDTVSTSSTGLFIKPRRSVVLKKSSSVNKDSALPPSTPRGRDTSAPLGNHLSL